VLDVSMRLIRVVFHFSSLFDNRLGVIVMFACTYNISIRDASTTTDQYCYDVRLGQSSTLTH
jgi:hypothetical protein